MATYKTLDAIRLQRLHFLTRNLFQDGASHTMIGSMGRSLLGKKPVINHLWYLGLRSPLESNEMSSTIGSQLGSFVQLNTDYETALTRTTDALKAEGFGVLTGIDVRETLKKKLGADMLPHKILGACNPPSAHRALTAAPEVGLLLPCNVTVRQIEEGRIEVAVIDPLTMLGVVVNPALEPIADEARARLERVAQSFRK
jgi:uncharacterized protein (DUF302 family)